MIGNHVVKVQSKAASLSGSSRKTVRSMFNIGAPLTNTVSSQQIHQRKITQRKSIFTSERAQRDRK